MAQGVITQRPAWARYSAVDREAMTAEPPPTPAILDTGETALVTDEVVEPERQAPPAARRIELDEEGFVIAIDGRPIF